MSELLYHYTDAAGLIGILRSKSLWASEYRFLNDRSEFAYGLKIMIAALDQYREDIQTLFPEAALLLDEQINIASKARVYGFVISLSKNGGLLSQWRGYNGGRGYSIGFDFAILRECARKRGFSLFPVIYDESEQFRSAQGAVRYLIQCLDDLQGNSSRVLETVTRWWEGALKTVLAFKDGSFSEESEYRVAFVSHEWPDQIDVRPSRHGILPYLPCVLEGESQRITFFGGPSKLLNRIVIGPALDPRQVLAVSGLLNKFGSDAGVEVSKIPYVGS